jgi:predicted small lipoprotein YifL
MKTIAVLFALVSLAGCGTTPPELPPCDTLTTVRFVSRCDPERARCALLSTAPPGAVASGCALTIVAVPGGPEQVECVESCD